MTPANIEDSVKIVETDEVDNTIKIIGIIFLIRRNIITKITMIIFSNISSNTSKTIRNVSMITDAIHTTRMIHSELQAYCVVDYIKQ